MTILSPVTPTAEGSLLLSKIKQVANLTTKIRTKRIKVLRVIYELGGSKQIFGRSLREINIDHNLQWPQISREYIVASIECILGIEPGSIKPNQLLPLKSLILKEPQDARNIEIPESSKSMIQECWGYAQKKYKTEFPQEAELEDAAQYIRNLYNIPEPVRKVTVANITNEYIELQERYENNRKRLLEVTQAYNQLLKQSEGGNTTKSSESIQLSSFDSHTVELLNSEIWRLRAEKEQEAILADEARDTIKQYQLRIKTLSQQHAELRERYDKLIRQVAQQSKYFQKVG